MEICSHKQETDMLLCTGLCAIGEFVQRGTSASGGMTASVFLSTRAERGKFMPPTVKPWPFCMVFHIKMLVYRDT